MDLCFSGSVFPKILYWVFGIVVWTLCLNAASVDTLVKAVQQNIVDFHNAKRRIIPSTSTLKMSWNEEARKIAQAWADQCIQGKHPRNDAERKKYLSIPGFTCGQNLAWGNYEMTWEAVVDMWYNEISDFQFGKNNGKMIGHYTALVWNSTYLLGCGFKKCNPGRSDEFYSYVCDYCPAGNIMPHQFEPYEAGPACKKCPNSCEKGLCTNPCPYTNEYSNCEKSEGLPALFPNGCSRAPGYLRDLKKQCQATCKCQGKKIYRL